MITFEDIEQTKSALNDAVVLQDRLLKTKSAYDTQTNMNRKLMQELNKLIGKYFTEPKKAYVHEYKDTVGKTGSTLQISKCGIGKTPSYNTNITIFGELIDNYDGYSYSSKGMIGEVIRHKNIYDKVYSHLSANGQYILKSLKETYEHNEITNPDKNELVIEIPSNKSERNVLNMSKTFIRITDRGHTPKIIISRKKEEESSYQRTNSVVFCLNDIKMNDERDFTYFLYTQYHVKEINDALDKYLEQTKERMDVWQGFNDELKQKLAKFLVLMEL